MKRFLFGLLIVALAASWRALLRGRRMRQALRTSSPSASGPPSYDEIAQRAYFIGLDHEANGEKSDPQRDWAEAEQELLT